MKPQRIESIKACKCSQCGQWFYYKRITSQFCSDKCRKRNQRGIEPTDMYKNDLFTENERILAGIAEHNPQAFREIEYIKEHFGQKALDRTMSVIRLLGIGD